MTDSYIQLKVPKFALEIPTDVLEHHLTWLCELIMKYSTTKLDIDKILADCEVQKKEIKESLEKQYNKQIDELKRQIKKSQDEVNYLTTERTKAIEEQLLLMNDSLKPLVVFYNQMKESDSIENTDTTTKDSYENINTNKKIKLDLENTGNCIKQIKDLYIRLAINKQPNNVKDLLSFLPIDIEMLDMLGGYDDITSAAELDYTASILNDRVVKKILEYKKSTGYYPTRKDIVQKKILTDSAIRKLFSVIKTKKQVDYIANYCESKLDLIASDHDEQNESDEHDDIDQIICKKIKAKSKIPKRQIQEPI